jgi:hypothetical protein
LRPAAQTSASAIATPARTKPAVAERTTDSRPTQRGASGASAKKSAISGPAVLATSRSTVAARAPSARRTAR